MLTVRNARAFFALAFVLLGLRGLAALLAQRDDATALVLGVCVVLLVVADRLTLGGRAAAHAAALLGLVVAVASTFVGLLAGGITVAGSGAAALGVVFIEVALSKEQEAEEALAAGATGPRPHAVPLPPPPSRSAAEPSAPVPPPQPRFVPAPAGPVAPAPAPPSRFAPAAPASRFAPAPAAAPAFATSAEQPAPLFGGRPAPRELTPLRSTTVSALTAERAEPEAPATALPPAPDDPDRRWGSPAAPGSGMQVLPQRGRSGRRRAAVPRQAPATAPVVAQAAAEVVADHVEAEPLPRPALGVMAPPAPTAPTAPAKADLTPRPGDPTIGAALLAPARAKLHELEPPLVRSWLALLDAGQRGEATPMLKAGQLAVLAAGLEDAAVRRRLLRAVADPFVDAVGLVTQDAPLDGLSAAGAPPGRVAAARELLLLVARTATGTPAQGAAVRAVKWLDRPAG